MRAGVVDAVVRAGDAPGDAQVLDRARRLGFLGVEIDLGEEHFAPGSRRRLESLLAARAAAAVAIPTLILGLHNRTGGIAAADAVAEAARDQIGTAVDWAGQLGADAVLVPFFLEAELRDAAAIERAAAAFAGLCPVAERAGLQLLYEGTLPAPAVLALAARVDSTAFGVCFDPANLVVEGLDPAAEALALGPLVRRVHLKDARERRGDCRLGAGRVDFPAVARALAGIGYDGWLVLETSPAPPVAVAEDLAFARSVFPKLSTT